VSSDCDDRNGSGGSGVSMSPSASLRTRRYVSGRVISALIQHKAASFSFETTDLRAIRMPSAKPGHDALCALASSHWERGL
jgi:hypothetical protein